MIPESDEQRRGRIRAYNHEMRELPATEREIRIIYGILAGIVFDGRKRFQRA